MSTPYGQQHPPQYGPGQQSSRTNPLAVTSMVLSLVGFVTTCIGLGYLLAIAGVVLGHISMGQIKREGSQGRGMGIAGIIVGYCVIALGVLGGILYFTGALTFTPM